MQPLSFNSSDKIKSRLLTQGGFDIDTNPISFPHKYSQTCLSL
ncbi:hypothetical protein SAMN05421788_108208 [Filimonas lacunae]|uniref:Uncharacterized protein n=1 Tax=Filimonas lacunae TaxID=477680 RepID=A0A1N7R222_9BACT|nr:hypothetical protein SAMN05421788_108208 [Filimonas lacunae]